MIDFTVKILIYIIIDWLSQSNQIIVLCWSGNITIVDEHDCPKPNYSYGCFDVGAVVVVGLWQQYRLYFFW